MPEVVVIGGGMAGCAAAATAVKVGASVTLLERMEVLGGCGLLAGLIDHKAFPLLEELKVMGGDDIYQVIQGCVIHKSVNIPYPRPGKTVTAFDITRLGSELKKYVKSIGVQVRLQSRARDVRMHGSRINSVILDDGTVVKGDQFVDATGGFGPEINCRKYGNGCAMCFLRCPAFGGRVSIAAMAGVRELEGKKPDGSIGPMSSAYMLLKDSLSREVRNELESTGCALIPLPPELINQKRTENITASVNIDDGFARNIVLADIGGGAKRIAGGYTPLDELRKASGLEHAVYIDPYAGTIGNAVRYMAITPRGDALNAPGIDNLFVASEKLGCNGIIVVAMTGVVAAYNAVRQAMGMPLMVFPRTTIIGDFIAEMNSKWQTEGITARFSPYSESYSRRAHELGLYGDQDAIGLRVRKAGLDGIFEKKIAP